MPEAARKAAKGRAAQAVWNGQALKGFPSDLVRAAQRKLAMLNAAVAVDTLRMPPGNRLERLKGDRVGQWSIRVNDQWRVCFLWRDGNAENVEIVDYH
ncbi:MAG: type II toxin-antitoxin system RelE/ParE family toxin [Alphaproteobacteria bacterium]|nr:MAG: type II toxin-antitoxin system RelE/ParE family toxin [Alphaproteobacteria bacterium]